MYKVLKIQLALVPLAALTGFVAAGQDAALAAVYGVLIAVALTLLQIWHAGRAQRLASANPVANVRILYRCALERFITAVVLFVLGFTVLQLMALPLLLGFTVALSAMVLGWLK
jgi:ATP synthase protein I